MPPSSERALPAKLALENVEPVADLTTVGYR